MENKIVKGIEKLFEGVQAVESMDMPCLLVSPEIILNVVKELKKQGFNFLADLTAVDYEEENQIEIVYHLMSVPEIKEIRLKVRVNREQPEVASLTGLWPAADVQEREVYDLFGVKFLGHPNLKRILCPDDFIGYPFRKDFVYEETDGAGGGE